MNFIQCLCFKPSAWKKVCSMVLLACTLPLAGTVDAAGQSDARTVTGEVVDKNNQPVAGAFVVVSGTQNGTSTDYDGNFSLSRVTSSDVLEISCLGFKTVTVTVGDQDIFSIVLEDDTNYLDEVVVVGYGTTTRRHLMSSVATVQNEVIENRPVANIQQALQGAAANLIIQTKNFDPTNNEMNLSIRGISTMGNNTPLVVIDGVPQADAGRMNNLNPNDIENISVLKDAGAAAIYGARSSNGVILITTKGGKKETAPEIRFSAQVGTQNPHILFDFLPSYQNSILRNEALTNVGQAPTFTPAEIRDFYEHGDCEPFIEQAMRNALQQNYNVSVSGGTEHTTYMISANYFDQETNYVGDYSMKHYNVRSNITTEIGRLKLGLNLAFTGENNKTPTTSSFLFADLARFPTYYFYRLKDEATGIYTGNNYKYGGYSGSPIAGLESGGWNKFDNNYISGTFTAEYEILKGLKARAVLGGEIRNSHRFSDHMTYYQMTDNGTSYADPSSAVLAGSTTNPADDWVSKDTYLTGQVMLDFNRTFAEKHTVTALVGWSQESNYHYSINSSKSYLNDLNQPTDETVIETGTSLSSQDNTRSALMSYFGRVGYSYDERYYIDFTARYDMSSKFLRVRNAGFFPAVSVGWRLSQESFMENYRYKVGDLKFRASYGMNGNQQDVGLYDFLTTYGIWLDAYGFNGTSVSGLSFTMGNELLTWEKAKTFNVGLDATFFKNKLSVSLDYFYKRTSDILLSPITVGIFGASIAKENRGVMDNNGWELTVNYNLVKGAWNHNFSFNIADSMNKVVKYGDPSIHSVDGVSVIIKEGLPLNSYYGFKTDGFFQTYDEIQSAAVPTGVDRTQLRPGDVKYVDINKDGVINDDDRTYLGYGFPRYTFGFNYSVSWKGIDLNIMLQGVLKRTSAVRGELVQPFHSDYGMATYEHMLDYWTPSNTDARWPRLAANGSVSNINNWGQPGSELNMIEGAYLRVKNIQLGYTLPRKWTDKFGCKALRIYFDAQNPLTFTKHGWVDPESTEFGSNMSRGGANSLRNYPTLRYFGGGIDITF